MKTLSRSVDVLATEIDMFKRAIKKETRPEDIEKFQKAIDVRLERIKKLEPDYYTFLTKKVD